MSLFWLILICFSVLFGFSVFFGAPYLPTRKKQYEAAFKLLKLKAGQTIIDLGSGDGSVLFAAAKEGYKAVGYELNPLLFLISYIRTVKYRRNVQLYLANFWTREWPPAEGIFVFLREDYMEKLNKKLVQYAHKPVFVASYAFKISNREVVDELSGVYLYKYK